MKIGNKGAVGAFVIIGAIAVAMMLTMTNSDNQQLFATTFYCSQENIGKTWNLCVGNQLQKKTCSSVGTISSSVIENCANGCIKGTPNDYCFNGDVIPPTTSVYSTTPTTTVTTISSVKCYASYQDKYYNYLEGYTTGCSQDGHIYKYTCKSDGTWDKVVYSSCDSNCAPLGTTCYNDGIVPCCSGSKCEFQFWENKFKCVSTGETTTTKPTTTSTVCNGCIHMGNCIQVGSIIGTSCIGGKTYLKTCQSDKTWKDVVGGDCGGICNEAGSECSNSAGSLPCCSGTSCTFQIFENKFRCMSDSGTTTTVPINCAGKCEYKNDVGEVKSCLDIGQKVSTGCAEDGWFYTKTCKTDGTLLVEKYKECTNFDSTCNIVTGEYGGFDVISECEKDSGCGVLGKIGSITEPVIQRVNSVVNAVRTKLGLPTVEFKSKCDICTELYKNCKYNDCDMSYTICTDKEHSIICTIKSIMCKVNSDVMNLKILWGEITFALVGLVAILILANMFGVFSMYGMRR